MIRIGVQQDIDQVVGRLAEQFPRQVQIAQQRAVIGTARIVKDEVVKEMRRAFDRPTKWTLNAFRVAIGKEALSLGLMRPEAGGEISARVEVKNLDDYQTDAYLQTQIEGAASRKQKKFEEALVKRGLLQRGWYVVPGAKARLDAYGNISRGQIRQVLAWFDAAEKTLGSTQNMGETGRNRRRKGTRKTRGFEYFAALPGHRIGRGSWKNGRTQNLQPGIYRRTFFGFGGAIEPIMIFVRQAQYSPRFKFNEVATRTVRREFKPRLERALADELAKVQG